MYLLLSKDDKAFHDALRHDRILSLVGGADGAKTEYGVVGYQYPSILVIEFDHRDEMAVAYAIKRGECRDLDLLVWRKQYRGLA